MTEAKAGRTPTRRATAKTQDPSIVVADLEDMTCGEIEEFEERTGNPVNFYTAKGTPQGKALRVLGWIFKLREDPEFTYEDAANLRVGIKLSAPVPPTDESA